uniref:NADH-ubiquinone oxidoreductase chain 2 n=1 Tax=Downesia tarsata TaxID=2790390 RepID=A0A7T1C5G3_9CUCU|nr:NADH dehydrogenase subunit 2 [Downesia tarsata]QPM99425.1 NADH dehydrogenase subunit 2 [Downesia tarsata]
MTKFNKLFFLNFTLAGTMISISSFSWFMMWLGMEMNLMSFIPLMKCNSNKSSEAMSKYFIIQSLASSMLLLSIIMKNNMLLNNSQLGDLIMFTSLIMKLGMAPMHFWLPEVAEGLKWSNCFMLLTWQKIAPFVFMIMSVKNSIMFITSIILSSLIGSIMGLGQISLRKMLAYSSINHMAWMMCSFMNNYIWIIYIVIYTMTNFNLMFYFSKLKIFYLNHIQTSSNNLFMSLFIMLNFLSLSGLPPLIGFLPKWLTVLWLVENNFLMLPLILIILTLMSIFFYIRVLFPMFLLSQNNKFYFNKNPINSMFLSFNLMILFSLIFLSWSSWF